MAHVEIHRDDIELDAPTLVEGLPGVGLVGKLAADHLVDAFEMVHYGTARCDGLPEIAVYTEGPSTPRATRRSGVRYDCTRTPSGTCWYFRATHRSRPRPPSRSRAVSSTGSSATT